MYASIKIFQTVLLVIPIKFARTQQINDHSDCTVLNVYCISASDYIHFIAQLVFKFYCCIDIMT